MIDIKIYRGNPSELERTTVYSRLIRLLNLRPSFDSNVNSLYATLIRPHKLGHTAIELNMIKFTENSSNRKGIREHIYKSKLLQIKFYAQHNW